MKVRYLAYQNTFLKKSKLLLGARILIQGVKDKIFSTKYSHDNIVDAKSGVYEVDCSGFVNTIIISQKLTKALQEIQNFTDKNQDLPKPRIPLQLWPLHYVRFLQSNEKKRCWEIIKEVKLLEPGDIIAYTKNNYENSTNEDGQHIMIVADKVKLTENSSWFFVPIFDSTKKLHGPNDFRALQGRDGKNDGGIGQAAIMLEVDIQGHPSQIKWYPESRYPKHRSITMARCLERNC